MQDDHRSLKATSEAMLEAKDTELLAALRKSVLLTEELGQLRQQQQQQRQHSLSASKHQQQQRISSSSAVDGAAGAGSDAFQFGVAAGEEGSSTPSRQDTGGLTGAAYASQQLLSGYTASEPGENLSRHTVQRSYQAHYALTSGAAYASQKPLSDNTASEPGQP